MSNEELNDEEIREAQERVTKLKEFSRDDTRAIIKSVMEAKEQIFSYVPRIGFFGKTGAGKSSLGNALFGKNLFKISDVAACTRHPREEILRISAGQSIALIDVPGVGENEKRDVEYGELYASLLPGLDAIFWLLKADERAYSTDQKYFETLVKPMIDNGTPVFFVLNQVDKIEPFREWDRNMHKPSDKQLKNIEVKRNLVVSEFKNSIPLSRVIAISANEGYGLGNLVSELIHTLPDIKKPSVAYNFSNKNLIDRLARKEIRVATMRATQEQASAIIDNDPTLSYEQKETRKKGIGSIIESISSGALAGAALGSKFFGPVGGVVGGIIGGVGGFVMGLFDW